MTYAQKLTLYNAELAAYRKLVDKKADVIIPPEEMVVFPFYTASTNWAIEKLGIDTLKTALKDKINAHNRKVHIVIHDDSDVIVHPKLTYAFNPQRAWNTTGRVSEARDNHAHMVAGTIAAEGNIGVIEDLVKQGRVVLWFGKCMSLGTGSYSWIANSLTKAHDIQINSGDFVINNGSFGGGGSNTSIEQAIQKGQSLGQYYNFSAGNSGYSNTGSTVKFPANLPFTSAIAAFNEQLNWLSYSSVGPEVSRASASNVHTVTRSTEGPANGTSFSAPIDSGIMALLMLAYPDKAEQGQTEFDKFVRGGLLDLGEDGHDNYFGYGAVTYDSWKNRSDEPIDDPVDEPDDEPDVPQLPMHPNDETYTQVIDAVMRPIWGRPGEQMRTADLELTVDVTSKVYAEFLYEYINSYFKDYFSSRGFILRPQDDIDSVLYWIAHFVEMMFPRLYNQKVVIARIKDKNTGVERLYPKKSLASAFAAKKGIYTYKKSKDGSVNKTTARSKEKILTNNELVGEFRRN